MVSKAKRAYWYQTTPDSVNNFGRRARTMARVASLDYAWTMACVRQGGGAKSRRVAAPSSVVAYVLCLFPSYLRERWRHD